MKIEDVPEGNWMILDNDRTVLFHSKSLKDISVKSKEYKIGTVVMERKFTGLIY